MTPATDSVVWLTQTPATDIHPLALRHLHRDDLSVVFVHASPADTSLPRAARNLLRAMGKDENATGMRMHASDSVHVTPTWLIAHRTRLVIVASPQLWPQRVLTDFLRLLCATPAAVLLIADHERGTEVASTCVGYLPVTLEWTAIPRGLSLQPSRMEHVSPVTVPGTDWLTYRADCRDQLPADQFEPLDKHYRAMLDHASQTLTDLGVRDGEGASLTEQQVQDILKFVVHASANTEEAITGFRAAQAAFFRAGYNLRIDVDRLIAILGHTRSPNYTDADWRALRAYRDPARPAICTLYGHHIPVDAISRFTLHDAREALISGVLAGQTLRPEARVFIYAHLLHRRMEGADDTSPFIAMKTIGAALTAAARDTGVLVAGRPNHSSRNTEKIWFAGRGYTYGRLS